MTITRRQTLVGISSIGALAGAGFYFGSHRLDALAKVDHINPLKIPPLLNGKIDNGRKIFDLSAQHGKSEFFENRYTPTIGLNGSFLGPTIRCKAGDQVTYNVRNNLETSTTLHWHGFHVPSKHDGGPHQVIKPDDIWSPFFEVKQKASLIWYHSHLIGLTGQQVNQGLAGLILVNDDESAVLGLPSDYGIDDVPLVIQDRRFNEDGSFAYLTSMHDRMMGFKGDTILVNGTARAHLTVRRQLTRLRILNGSNSRIYNFGLENDQSFTQIASDGSLLARPVKRRRLRLAPGERAEIIVDMGTSRRLLLMSYPDIIRGSTGMMGRMMRGMAGNNETFSVLELRADRLEKTNTSIPKQLIKVPSWQASQARRTRSFDLEMGMMGGRGGMGMMGEQMTINGKSMDMERIDERVKLGSIEIWTIRNSTPVSHPFHIHDIQFRILDRDGKLPAPHEAGLKDTVLVDPGENVRVIAEFNDFADSNIPYMYHCHILEHEDAGMMGQFVVTA